jgi:hypothetical protein
VLDIYMALDYDKGYMFLQYIFDRVGKSGRKFLANDACCDVASSRRRLAEMLQ